MTPSSGSGPSGSVTFSTDGIALGSSPVTTDGGVTTAVLDVSSLPLGSQSITASYDGDVRFGASASPAVVQVINPDATSVAITPSSSSAEPGEPVTYTATVSSTATGTPTGAVSFTDDGSPIVGCQSLGLPPSAPLHVTCTETSGSIATHSIVATYSGDTHFLTATGILAEDVAPMSTTTTIVVSPPAPTYGQSVTLTSTVAPTSGTTDPGGTVTYSVNGTMLGSSMLTTTSGVTTASMLVTTLPVGSDFVTASYDGGDGFLASSSAAAAPVVVSRTPTSLGLFTSGTPTPPAQSVTFTATIFPTTGSGETGTVTFFDNGVAIGTSSVSNGQATLSATGLPSGTDPITAGYGGDGDFVGSVTADPLPQVVAIPRRRERALHQLKWRGSRGGIKQANPCYIHPEERTRRSEGWAAMSVAIVTGASRGLGEALASGLARAGWSVVIDGRDQRRRSTRRPTGSARTRRRAHGSSRWPVTSPTPITATS